MGEDPAELRDRARRYRRLASMVTDERVTEAILKLADELDERSRAADGELPRGSSEPI